MPRLLPVALAAVTTFGLALPASASQPDLFGYGPRGIAMVGSIVSTARGHEAVYYNAAGLGLDHDLSFDVGFQVGVLELSINDERQDTRDSPALTVGFCVPIPFGGPLEDRLTLGLAFVIPQSSVLIADIPRPSDPSFVLVENRAQTVSIQGGLGVRILDELAIGIGFLALAELDGGIDVAPNAAGNIGSTVKSELVASWSMSVGILAEPLPFLSVGLTWRDESIASFVYPMTVDLGSEFNLPVPRLDVSGTAQYDPMQIALEVGARPVDELLLSLVGIYKFWSAFENPIVYTAVREDTPPQPEPDFSDTVVVRLGAEATFAVDEWTIVGRLGVGYEPSPAPEMTGFHNYLDNDRVQVGFGIGLRWKALSLDLAGQVQHLLPRTSVKDPDVITEADENPGFPSISHTGNLFVFGAELGVTL